MAYGFVYALRNQAMSGLYKIGMTEGSPTKRASELSSSTSVPFPFEVVCYMEVDDCQAAERDMHYQLSDYRVNAGREFFKCPIRMIVKLFETSEYMLHVMDEEVPIFEKREGEIFKDFEWPGTEVGQIAETTEQV